MLYRFIVRVPGLVRPIIINLLPLASFYPILSFSSSSLHMCFIEYNPFSSINMYLLCMSFHEYLTFGDMKKSDSSLRCRAA